MITKRSKKDTCRKIDKENNRRKGGKEAWKNEKREKGERERRKEGKERRKDGRNNERYEGKQAGREKRKKKTRLKKTKDRIDKIKLKTGKGRETRCTDNIQKILIILIFFYTEKKDAWKKKVKT